MSFSGVRYRNFRARKFAARAVARTRGRCSTRRSTTPMPPSTTMPPHRNLAFKAAPWRGQPISASSHRCARRSGARLGSRPAASPRIIATLLSRAKRCRRISRGRRLAQDITTIGMTKRDGTEILRGTASIGGATGTALELRLKELKPLADPVILHDLKVGMKTTRQTVKMDFDQHMGDLYPFSLRDKLKVVTEPSPYYSGADNPWGRPIVPFEMLSVLFQYRAREDPLQFAGGRSACSPTRKSGCMRGPDLRRRELQHRTRGRGALRQPSHRERLGAARPCSPWTTRQPRSCCSISPASGLLCQLRKRVQRTLWLSQRFYNSIESRE